MKIFVRDGQGYFTTNYIQYNDSKGKVRIHITGLEFCSLRVVSQQMNMKREERKPTRCNNIDGLLSIMDVGY